MTAALAQGRQPRTGDRYEWHGLTIEVGEVDPGGAWAMIHCTTPRETWDHKHWTQEWDKQQPTPAGRFPADWQPIEGAA